MVGITLSGRLGNQMFQYAFGLMLIKQYNYTVFFIFHKQGLNKTILHRYFTLNSFSNTKNYFLYLFFKLLQPKAKQIHLENSNKYNTIQYNHIRSCIISGYFQSELYFKDISHLIKKTFTIKKNYITDFNNKYHYLFKQNRTIAIHLRKGDYMLHGSEELGGQDISLPLSYYQKCLATIHNIEMYKIIFVSDEIEKTKKQFHFIPNAIFESNKDIIDFQILMNADICIISNSTFSWWAAYLNNKNKIIYAPKYWLGFKVNQEYPVGIMSVNWKWMDVV
jgi:hypothetical protein